MKTKYRVLYVDDEESNLRIFKDTFRRDFEIILAISAYQAMEVLEQKAIDIVITDQRMPGMTGVELLDLINQKFPHIPPGRLIVSGFSDYDQIEKAFEQYKLFKFISKPWKYDELKQIILEAVENGKNST